MTIPAYEQIYDELSQFSENPNREVQEKALMVLQNLAVLQQLTEAERMAFVMM